MTGIDHVNIRATDQEAVRDFLIAALGAEVGPRPPFDFPGYWLYLGGRPVIHTSPRPAGEQHVGWMDHVAFGPFAFEATKARLDASGLSYRVSGIPGTAIRQLFVTGPEGVKLELQCPE
jgi:catechol 2,3-dioxygenase-like lactoylglutathione lyase family enzyme